MDTYLFLFLDIFTEEDRNFCDFLFASVDNEALPKWGLVSKDFFSLRVDPLAHPNLNNRQNCVSVSVFILLNPTALRKAKIVYNFGLSECKRVYQYQRLTSVPHYTYRLSRIWSDK